MINKIKKSFKMPPHIVLKKILFKLKNKIKDVNCKRKDFCFDTRINFNLPFLTNSYIDFNELDISKIDNNVAKYLCEMHLQHRFDLLGSGWVKNSYDSIAMGLENYKYEMNVVINNFDEDGTWLKSILLPQHINSSQKIWKNINNSDSKYIPIDWQKDYKSGYRWDSKKWYKEQRIGNNPGADIKVPWELARMQHLPQIAIFSKIIPEYKNKLIIEFKNQVIDFISTNPPRFGANWVCPMDVGIRATNMLIAYDLFTQIDENKILNNEFKQIFANSIYEHGLHIVNNLEYSEWLTSNHYLSDIVGLLFISAYLSGSSKENKHNINTWLAFSFQEIINEMKNEFYEDGSNFEASTSYHRLSSELMIYSSALIFGLIQNQNIQNIILKYDNKNWNFTPELKSFEKQEYDLNSKKFFPQWFIDRLFKAAKFTEHLTKPTGEIPQIGDNDSGRFLKLSPNGIFLNNQDAEKKYYNLLNYNFFYDNSENNIIKDKFWDENILNHKTLLSAFNGIFDNKFLINQTFEFPLEQSFINSLAKKSKLQPKTCAFSNTYLIKKSIYTNFKIDLDEELKYNNQTIIKPDINSEIPLTQNLKLYSYPNSGIYIFKSDRLHLTISAGPNGQNGSGGHAHNDKLSFELNLDGKDVIVDPGTYLYTPIPEKRNLFRSTKLHNTILIDNTEQNSYNNNSLFSMLNETKCYLIDYNNKSIILLLTYKSIIQKRKFNVFNDKIIITDWLNYKFKKNIQNIKEIKYFSNGYGKIIKMI